MIEFKGIYFDGKTSKPHAVTLYFDGSSLCITGDDLPSELSVPIGDCTIVPSAGKGVRAIYVPGGGLCETGDFRAVEAIEGDKGMKKGFRFIHFLESNWKAVAGCAVCLCIFIWLAIAHGVPFAAERVADSVPRDLMNTMGREALTVLDSRFLEPSRLPANTMEQVTSLFGTISREMDDEGNYRLLFRKGRCLGPNAFALPSGTILLTDELVGLSRNDRELAGILAHEIVHVKKRHALRQLLQSAGVFLLVSFIVGDIASISTFAATLPVLLVESGYSREFEREADREAGLYLIGKGWGTKPYRDILARITKGRNGYPGMTAFSTHPETKKRIEDLEELERSTR